MGSNRLLTKETASLTPKWCMASLHTYSLKLLLNTARPSARRLQGINQVAWHNFRNITSLINPDIAAILWSILLLLPDCDQSCYCCHIGCHIGHNISFAVSCMHQFRCSFVYYTPFQSMTWALLLINEGCWICVLTPMACSLWKLAFHDYCTWKVWGQLPWAASPSALPWSWPPPPVWWHAHHLAAANKMNIIAIKWCLSCMRMCLWVSVNILFIGKVCM